MNSAGVSTDKAEAGLGRLTARIAATWGVPRGQTGAVHLSFGHYANVIEIAGQGIAFSCDGVGSKTLIAQLLDKYDTIGIDCIAMNVNDILCVGATPVSLVDYIAVETAAPGCSTSWPSVSRRAPAWRASPSPAARSPSCRA